MAAKVLYTKKGSDPSSVLWPSAGPPRERWTFTDGTPLNVPELIGFPDHIEFADGRIFPDLSAQGSTMKHQKG